MSTLFSEVHPSLRFQDYIANRGRLQTTLESVRIRNFASCSFRYKSTTGSEIEREFQGQLINPILRASIDLQYHTSIHYLVRMNEDIAAGRMRLKGIILEAYGAVDGQKETPDLDMLAREGYVVIFMNGHDLAAQTQAAGARSTLRDIYYMAMLIKDSRLRDFAGNAPLTTWLDYTDGVPFIFKGYSHGGFLALNLATNQENLAFHFTVPSRIGIPEGMSYNCTDIDGTIRVTSQAGRYHEPFDAFIAECAWFPSQEAAIATSDPRHTEASKMRAELRDCHGWQSAVQPRARGMEQNESAPGLSLNAMQNAHYLNKPLLLVTCKQDLNTPVVFLYDFAASAITHSINNPTSGAVICQYYYQADICNPNSHNSPKLPSQNPEYFQIKSRFVERLKLHKNGWRVIMTDDDLTLTHSASFINSSANLLSACLRYDQPEASAVRTEYVREQQEFAEIQRVVVTQPTAQAYLMLAERTEAPQISMLTRSTRALEPNVDEISRAKEILEEIDSQIYCNQYLTLYPTSQLVQLCHKIKDEYTFNLHLRNSGIISLTAGAMTLIVVLATNGMAISLLLVPSLSIFAIIGFGLAAIGATLTTVGHLRNSDIISGETLIDLDDSEVDRVSFRP